MKLSNCLNRTARHRCVVRAAFVAHRALFVGVLASASGCGGGPQFAPVEGKVYYKDQPLQFGSVMFQPAQGQPARGVIQSDGSFKLWTHKKGDGAILGTHRVRIVSYEGQRGGQRGPGEQVTLGRLLIPQKYGNIDTSGIEVEVRAKIEPIEFRLEDD